ncbi:MAG: Crp/Fnr family transcriptional regulator [Candidatus Promineofilum sp.]|nr:Crp/Fnr family transcriptional regulator [Promineifilum sp.]
MRSLPFFSGLDNDTLAELARAARRREYRAGEVIVLEGEAQPGLYFLETGYVKVVKSAPTGREQTLRVLEPDDTFNEIGVFSRRPNPATAIALEPSAVWLIPRDTLTGLLRERPDFAQSVIERMAERMLFLVGLVSDLSLRPVTGRMARLLLEGAVDDIVARPRWFTQAELASRLGTVPDVVQRALRALEADGVITVDRAQIRILDRPTLEQLANPAETRQKSATGS